MDYGASLLATLSEPEPKLDSSVLSFLRCSTPVSRWKFYRGFIEGMNTQAKKRLIKAQKITSLIEMFLNFQRRKAAHEVSKTTNTTLKSKTEKKIERRTDLLMGLD